MGYFIKYRTLNPNSQYYYSPTFNVSGAITLSGLLPATAYEFNLVAMSYANLQSTVDLCSPSSYTTQAITAPAAPAALTVTSTSLEFSGTTYFAKAALSWTAVSGTDIVGYYVTVLPAGGGNFTLPLATGTTITIHGLIPGGSYTFDVVAKNEANLYSTPTYNTGGTIIMPIPTVPTISSLSITYDEDMNITFSQSGTLAMITHYDVAMTVGITTHDITIAASVNSTINKVFTYRLLASIWGGVHAFNSISITGRTNGYGDTNTITATTVDCVNPAAPTSVIINDSGGDGGGGYAPGGITMTATSHQGQYPNTHFLVYSSPTSSPFVPTLQFEMLNSLPNIAWYGIPNLYYRTNAYSINSYAMTSSSYTTSNIVQCGGVHSIDVISLDGTKLTNQITRTVLDASDLSGSVNISGTAITNLDQSTVFTKVNT